LRRYKQLVEVGVFQRGWVTKRKFQVEEDIAHQSLWYQKTRLITRSCDIKISAILSFRHKARVCRTDRRTDRQTDRQNYDPQDRAIIAASRRKNRRHHQRVTKCCTDECVSTNTVVQMCLQSNLLIVSLIAHSWSAHWSAHCYS